MQHEMTEMREFFDKLAPEWDEMAQDASAQISTILGMFCFAQDAKVLDVACGTGVMFPHLLAQNPSEINAIDLSPEMVQRARKKCDDARVSVQEADFFEYEGEGYDIIVVYNAYPHFLDKSRFAKKAAELLKKGGRLLIAHSDSRAVVNGRHSGGEVEDVSDGLFTCAQEAQRLGDAFTYDIMVDTQRMYVLSGVLLG